MSRRFRWWRGRQRFGYLLIDPLVGTAVVEEGDVLTHNASDVTLAENQDVIQAFASNTTEKALTKRIGFRRLQGRAEQLDMSTRDRSLKLQPIFVIVVADQEAWPNPKTGRLTHLLCDPGVARTARNSQMHDPS